MKKTIFFLCLIMVSTTLLNAQSTCAITTAQVDLDINNVRARILVGGDLWWDPVSQTPYYEVPKGSGKISIYSGAIWIGGYDNSGQLVTAAQTYRQTGSNDFWGGPISKDISSGSLSITPVVCYQYDRIWKINRTDVQNFIQGGAATIDIQEWPGNGDLVNNQLPYLAPFFDADNDGIYNYLNGDYPYFNFSGVYPIDPNTQQPICNDYLFGDQCLWWVFNDIGNVKTETNSIPIGIEIRAQAYSYSSTDVDLNNATFYKYQIINRRSDSLLQTNFGIWVDPDLGNFADDYVGCDVGLGLGFCYNGDANDDGSDGYGIDPPAVGVDFFQGPLADGADLIDNDRDGITDEIGEEVMMSKFMYYQNVNNAPTGNPNLADDYYNYLSGEWLDGIPITYGGDGRGGGNNPTSTVCDFMFPGVSDPSFTTNWDMANGGLLPSDMRWIQSAGRFSLAPGSVNYVTTGVVWARSTGGGPLGSLADLKQADLRLQALFNSCFNTSILSVEENTLDITIGPNPFVSYCAIDLSQINPGKLTMKIFSVNGKLLEVKQVSTGSILLFGENYSSGIYLVKFELNERNYSTKIVKL